MNSCIFKESNINILVVRMPPAPSIHFVIPEVPLEWSDNEATTCDPYRPFRSFAVYNKAHKCNDLKCNN